MPNNILIIPICTARVWINRVCHRDNIKHIIILHCVELALVAPIRVYAYIFTILRAIHYNIIIYYHARHPVNKILLFSCFISLPVSSL